MFHTAPSPARSAPQSSAYGFATPARTPSTSYNTASYSQALTPADASASKAVRFQNQPLPPQVQQQQQAQSQQSSSLTTAATPNRSPYYNAVSAPTPVQSQTSNRNTLTTTSSSPAVSSNKIAGTRAAVASVAGGGSDSSESAIALTRRIKWNVGALGILWIVPALSTRPRDVYWTILDQIYLHTGGETDEVVDGVVGWILWAISVVLLFNTVEAAVLMRRASTPTPPQIPAAPSHTEPRNDGTNKGPVLGMHSPHVAKSINFVAASRLKGSPKTRTSNIGAGSPISRSSPQQQRASPNQASPTVQTVDYSQFSPSLRRTSSPLPSPGSNSGGFGSSSRMGTPTHTGSDYGGALGVQPSSSPLAAFRARHASRSSASPSSIRARSITPSVSGGLGETSLSLDDRLDDEGGETFLGDESFEVDRALRNLRSSLGGVSSTPAPASSFR